MTDIRPIFGRLFRRSVDCYAADISTECRPIVSTDTTQGKHNPIFFHLFRLFFIFLIVLPTSFVSSLDTKYMLWMLNRAEELRLMKTNAKDDTLEQFSTPSERLETSKKVPICIAKT